VRHLMLVLIALICFLPLNANVAFRDGEKLVFTVKYGIVSAAEATLEAKSSSMNGRSAWNLSTDARTYPFFDAFFKVRDRVDSWWDKETLLPIKYTKNLQEGKYRQRRIHTFDHSNNTTNYQKYSFRQGIYKSEDMKMLANSQDVLSAFYHVRNQNLKPKQRLRVNITSDGRTMNTEIIVHRREKVKTIFGDINCLVIEPKLISGAVFKQTGRIIIWITDDAYKIPVKMESAVSFGSFVAELKEAYNVPYKVK
jgi:hypothetical protein